MLKGVYLGEFEVLVLAAVVLLEDDPYGPNIHRQVQSIVKDLREVSLGAVYTSLGRLERKGYLTSWTGGSPDGRAKKLYAATADGEAALQTSLKTSARLLESVKNR